MTPVLEATHLNKHFDDPLIVMSDESTGNLDSQNSEIVFVTFRRIAQEQQ